jgi:hypothetical protein
MTAVSCSLAFQVPPARFVIGVSRTSAVFLSSEEPKLRRKRLRRKDAPDITSSSSEEEQPTIPAAVMPDLKPRDDAPVELTIQDFRNVGSGKSVIKDSFKQQDASQSNESSTSSSSSYKTNNDDNNSDSMKQLLADAREMRRDVKDNDGDNSSGSILDTVRNILSTIVTIDFFVVCALLVWFLAGIFGSYVLKNDNVQIAFNGIFQPVVQPALGILMIGSAAGGTCMENDTMYHFRY